MRDVAVISSAFVHEPRAVGDEVELIESVVSKALAGCGVAKERIGFVCSGSADLLIGRPFSFVQGLDGIPAWPPIRESHVEMDGAWALYEAWMRLQLGDVDAALVYAFGRPSAGNLADVSVLQLDPYTVTPLWPDADSLANLQASVMRAPGSKPHPIFDGAAAVVLAVGDLARESCAKPAWITGLDHRTEAHALGVRRLGVSESTESAARHAWVATRAIGTAHLTASHSHATALLTAALLRAGLSPNAQVSTPPYTPMVSGLANIARAAQDVSSGRAIASLGHATSGACMQHNLICVVDANVGMLS